MSSNVEQPDPASKKEELSLVSLVLFAACGLLVFVIVFIFVKRQINRFSLKSRREPHRPIGSDAPAALRQEIMRLLENTVNIRFEPKLLREEEIQKLRHATKNGTCHYYYRMKACDSMALLDKELKGYSIHIHRKPHQDMRHFLLGLRTTGPLKDASAELVHNFCRAYDHARHDPEVFGLSEYNSFMDLLKELMNCVLVNRARKENPQKAQTSSPPAHSNPSESTALKTDFLMHGPGHEKIPHGKLDLHFLHAESSHSTKSPHPHTGEEIESLLEDDDDDTLVNDDESGSIAMATGGGELKPLMSSERVAEAVDMVTYIQPGSGTLTHRVRPGQHVGQDLLGKNETNL